MLKQQLTVGWAVVNVSFPYYILPSKLWAQILLFYSFFNRVFLSKVICHFLHVTAAFGVDAAFSYKYNQQHGICGEDGLAICPGFSTTHVIPASLLTSITDICVDEFVCKVQLVGVNSF